MNNQGRFDQQEAGFEEFPQGQQLLWPGLFPFLLSTLGRSVLMLQAQAELVDGHRGLLRGLLEMAHLGLPCGLLPLGELLEASLLLVKSALVVHLRSVHAVALREAVVRHLTLTEGELASL